VPNPFRRLSLYAKAACLNRDKRAKPARRPYLPHRLLVYQPPAVRATSAADASAGKEVSLGLPLHGYTNSNPI